MLVIIRRCNITISSSNRCICSKKLLDTMINSRCIWRWASSHSALSPAGSIRLTLNDLIHHDKFLIKSFPSASGNFMLHTSGEEPFSFRMKRILMMSPFNKSCCNKRFTWLDGHNQMRYFHASRHLSTVTSNKSSSSSSSSSSQTSSTAKVVKKLSHPDSSSDISLIRNLGIIAHIDAGKTTTTERMLYYSGLTENLGEVHDGDTVTDYMDQERSRGITITSASVTYPWKKHRINLIDTPGHVDFTVEVERCLSVLDSALVVLDASAGVEAQTITVWSQADRFSIPRLVYLNKMDRNDANVDLCLKSIRKLGSNPLLLHIPIKSDHPKIGKELTGIIDVVKLEKYIWSSDLLSDGSQYDVTKLDKDKDGDHYEKALSMREEIIGVLSDVDEKLSEAILTTDHMMAIPNNLILNAMRRGTIQRKVIPVLCGSSYKNIGVQILMDSLLQFLPSPLESLKKHSKYYNSGFCGLAFKIIHHKILGPLTFVRIYSGTLKPATKIFNVNRGNYESIHKIYLALADDFKELPSVTSGNIVAITGLSCVTGDTLVQDINCVEEAKRLYAERHPDQVNHDSVVLLAGPSVPEPVFFCTVESPSPSKEKPLMIGLENLQREDPSLKIRTDENGQIQMSGMGELHIEIIKDRLLKEYGVDAYMGPLQVAYRESIEREVTGSLTLTKMIGGTKNVASIKLVLKPNDQNPNENGFKVIITKDNDLGKLRPDRLKAIKNGIETALRFGPELNFPVLGLFIELHEFQTSYATTPAFISSVTSQVITSALKQESGCLMEPLMEIEITVPIEYSTKIISDLSSRRSHLAQVSDRNENPIIRNCDTFDEIYEL